MHTFWDGNTRKAIDKLILSLANRLCSKGFILQIQAYHYYGSVTLSSMRPSLHETPWFVSILVYAVEIFRYIVSVF